MVCWHTCLRPCWHTCLHTYSGFVSKAASWDTVLCSNTALGSGDGNILDEVADLNRQETKPTALLRTTAKALLRTAAVTCLDNRDFHDADVHIHRNAGGD